MKGKILLHFFDTGTQTPDRKWLFWLKQKLNKLGIESVESTERVVGKKDIIKLQKEFEISPKQTFIAHHNPGTLSLIRFVEKVLEYKLEKALLIAGKEQSAFKVLTRKELASGKGELQEIESLEKSLQHISPALIIIWIAENDRLAEKSKKLLLSQK